MLATTIKPIRATEIFFENDKELKEFQQYANSTKQTNDEIMNRVRRDFKNHKRSTRRK